LPIIAWQPGKARSIPMQDHAYIGRRGRFLRCVERRGAGRRRCSAIRVTA
jgi:hypothetical protein